MYVYGHVMPDLGANHHMGYYARCMMARTKIFSDGDKKVTFQISYDDPLQVFINGAKIYIDPVLSDGYKTRTVSADLQPGVNNLLVRMMDTPNNNTMWAGFSLSIQDSDQ
jgi:hypothetical protein